MSDEQSIGNQTDSKDASNGHMARYAWTAVLAALAGFGAVYVTFGLSDNGSSIETTSTITRPSPADAGVADSGNKSLRTGHMVTFVFKKSPQPLPEVSFTDGAGNPKSLKDWRGKVVLLNLWATWCAPCRREMPDLDKLQASLGSDKFEVLAISVDRKGLAASKRFLDQIKVKNLGLYNDVSAKMAGKLKVLGMPTTLLLDRDGREIGRLVGPAEWNSSDAHRLIKAHL